MMKTIRKNATETVSLGKYLTPFQRKLLQKNLQENLAKHYRQRIEIMLLADEGKSQTQICQATGCSHETARYWICMARTGQGHKWQDKPLGRPKAVNQEYLERLKELLSQSPRDNGYSFRRWTANWLSKHLAKELGIEISDRHVNRLLKEMGLSTRRLPDPRTKDNSNRIKIVDLKSPNSQQFWQLNLLNKRQNNG